MHNIEAVLHQIKEHLSKRPEVLAGYLYGSYARGEQVRGSDVDIGVLLLPDYKYDLYYLGGLYSEFEELGKREGIKIEAYIINDKTALFKHKVISPRKVIYCKDDNIRAQYEVRAMNDYFEYRPFMEQSFKSAVEMSKRRLHAKPEKEIFNNNSH